jgi:putative transposase
LDKTNQGSSIRLQTVAQLLADLGVATRHSQPPPTKDIPLLGSQLKNLKYRQEFLARFDYIEDTRVFCRNFPIEYNIEHYYSGIGLMIPQTFHNGRTG